MGAMMISFSGVWVKLAHVTPTASAFYRVLFGGLILLMPALWRQELKWKGMRQLSLAIACGLFLALDLTFYHYSIQYVGPGLGTILPNFEVLILMVVGILFLKEKAQPLFLISIPLAFAGLLMIVGLDWDALGRHYKVGIYYGLAAAFCYAALLLSLRKLQATQQGISIFYVWLIVSFASAAFLSVEIVRTGDTFWIPDWQSLWALMALGLLSQAAGWILITNALPHIQASTSGFVLLMQPALAFVWDVTLFQRPTSVVNWMGVLLALTAIYLGTLRTSRVT
jgi:drug/metabolite transporter (DMT)-like permease